MFEADCQLLGERAKFARRCHQSRSKPCTLHVFPSKARPLFVAGNELPLHELGNHGLWDPNGGGGDIRPAPRVQNQPSQQRRGAPIQDSHCTSRRTNFGGVLPLRPRERKKKERKVGWGWASDIATSRVPTAY